GGEWGAGRLALARAHRAQTARLLLAGTDMPITDVAFAAGFSSVRQFNETMAEIYHVAPGAIRASARRRHGIAHGPAAPATAAGTSLSLRLPARAPFDGVRALRILRARALRGVA